MTCDHGRFTIQVERPLQIQVFVIYPGYAIRETSNPEFLTVSLCQSKSLSWIVTMFG